MKIAYLVHTERPYEEIVELVKQLTKQGDHVFIIISDNDLRDKVNFVYMDYPKFHLSRKQDFAQEGDLSLARGTLLQMRDALETDHFDYFVNLTDGMMPIKTRSQIEAFLTEHENTDFYYVDHSEREDTQLRKNALKFYPFTNLLAFPRGKITRSITKGFASFLNIFHIRRSLEDEIQIGSPWFILTKESAGKLVDNLPYCSSAFKLSWYAEEMYLPMMLTKFGNPDHIHENADYRVVGPDGKWVPSQNTRLLPYEILEKHPEALFAGIISAEEDASLYANYFDIYNQDIE